MTTSSRSSFFAALALVAAVASCAQVLGFDEFHPAGGGAGAGGGQGGDSLCTPEGDAFEVFLGSDIVGQLVPDQLVVVSDGGAQHVMAVTTQPRSLIMRTLAGGPPSPEAPIELFNATGDLRTIDGFSQSGEVGAYVILGGEPGFVRMSPQVGFEPFTNCSGDFIELESLAARPSPPSGHRYYLTCKSTMAVPETRGIERGDWTSANPGLLTNVGQGAGDDPSLFVNHVVRSLFTVDQGEVPMDLLVTGDLVERSHFWFPDTVPMPEDKGPIEIGGELATVVGLAATPNLGALVVASVPAVAPIPVYSGVVATFNAETQPLVAGEWNTSSERWTMSPIASGPVDAFAVAASIDGTSVRLTHFDWSGAVHAFGHEVVPSQPGGTFGAARAAHLGSPGRVLAVWTEEGAVRARILSCRTKGGS
jgi:hypothetical protein